VATRPSIVVPIPVTSLTASTAMAVPSSPGSTPSTPASAQLGTVPGAGGTG